MEQNSGYSGIIPPQSDTKIYVDFIPKSIQKYDTFLHVDVEGVGKNIFSLPITAKYAFILHRHPLTSFFHLGVLFHV